MVCDPKIYDIDNPDRFTSEERHQRDRQHAFEWAEKKAKEAAGNWRKFRAFMPGSKLTEHPDGDNFYVFYTHHRESDLLEQSNAAVIRASLEKYEGETELDEGEEGRGDVEDYGASCSLVGWLEGHMVRVFKDRDATDPEERYTKAFLTVCLMDYYADGYPVLSDDHHSEMQCEAEWDNLKNSLFSICYPHKLDHEDILFLYTSADPSSSYLGHFEEDVVNGAISDITYFIHNSLEYEHHGEDVDGQGGGFLDEKEAKPILRELGYYSPDHEMRVALINEELLPILDLEKDLEVAKKRALHNYTDQYGEIGSEDEIEAIQDLVDQEEK